MDEKLPKAPRKGRFRTKILYRFIIDELKLGSEELWFDIWSFEWMRFWFWASIVSWIVGISMLCNQVILFSRKTADEFCVPNDEFNAWPEVYNFWDTASIFHVTVGFGKFTFGMAKFIDISFDVVSESMFSWLRPKLMGASIRLLGMEVKQY